MYNLSDADISGLHLMTEFHPGRRLVFGATGYIGSHLEPRLLAQGLSVRACGRSLSALESRQWSGADLCIADALEPESLEDALADIENADYLVHSMAASQFRTHRFPAGYRRRAQTRTGSGDRTACRHHSRTWLCGF